MKNLEGLMKDLNSISPINSTNNSSSKCWRKKLSMQRKKRIQYIPQIDKEGMIFQQISFLEKVQISILYENCLFLSFFDVFNVFCQNDVCNNTLEETKFTKYGIIYIENQLQLLLPNAIHSAKLSHVCLINCYVISNMICYLFHYWVWKHVSGIERWISHNA